MSLRRFAVLPVLAVLSLSACSVHDTLRTQTASRAAAPAWMIKREIAADPFSLTVFERMHEREAPATIYIEGDNISTLISETPQMPVALKLATKDSSANVVSIARPCQYSGMLEPEKSCGAPWTTDKKYSGEVLDSYNMAIDEIIARYDIEGIHLVGHSGGAAIAALLATQRDDVLSLRTVAGTMDTDLARQLRGKEPYAESLNPKDIAFKLRKLPQKHFTSARDYITPPALLESFLSAMGNTSCAEHMVVNGVTYDMWWENKWATLLKDPPACKSNF